MILSKIMNGVLIFALLLVNIAFGTISINKNGYFIGVYDDTNNYNWFEAKEYCMINFGSSLASIHSLNDQINLINSLIIDNITSWIGLNDIATESNYQWSDGTDYDYNLPLTSINNQDCSINKSIYK